MEEPRNHSLHSALWAFALGCLCVGASRDQGTTKSRIKNCPGGNMKRLNLLLSVLVLFGCGQAGAPGTSCSVKTITTPAAGSLISCNDGTSSVVLSGTVVQPVKFCHETASYPSTFPEYGFCIGNNLYAVYSLNDGFLTLVPPGAYHSNAVGSVCNFTVYANCVTQEN